MQRLVPFLAAVALSTVAASSACKAGAADDAGAPGANFRFTLESQANGNVYASFRRSDRESTNWTTNFKAVELGGLDTAQFNAGGPVGFAIVREAGRLDCVGAGGNGVARGSCDFTSDAGFANLLAARGIARPSQDQELAMMAVNVRRELIEALADARYPTPVADDLISLTAVGVSRDYIAGMAASGYRPETLDSLLQFKALGITPDYIGRFVAMGYGKLPANDLVQLKALNITPDYIAGFERIGLGRLPASQLVQLKALGITPAYAQSFRAIGYDGLDTSDLVQMKAIGVTADFARSVRRAGEGLPSPERLVRMRALGGDWARR